jgi:hypothetical protein
MRICDTDALLASLTAIQSAPRPATGPSICDSPESSDPARDTGSNSAMRQVALVGTRRRQLWASCHTVLRRQAQHRLRNALRSGRPVTFSQRVSRDMSNILCTRIFGVVARAGRISSLNASFYVRLLTLCGAPVVIALLQNLHGFHGAQKHTYLLWLLYFAGIDIVSTLAIRGAMVAAMRMWPELEAALTRRGFAAYRRWSNTNASLGRQAMLLVPLAVITLVALWMVRYTPLVNSFYIAFPSFLSVAISGSLAGNGAYWLIRGVRLSRMLAKPENLQLLWTAPARTPVVEGMAKIYRIAFYLAVLETAIYLFPVIWLANRDTTHDPIFIAIKLFFLGLALLGIVAVATVPQLRLSAVVSWHRTAGIKRAQQLLTTAGSLSEEIQIASLIKTIGDSPASTINDRTIVGIVLGVAAAIGPNLVQILAR